MSESVNLEPTLPALRAEVLEAMDAVAAAPQVKVALEKIEADLETTLADQIELTEIPSPPFAEEQRARAFEAKLCALGFEEVSRDGIGNVIGLRRGTGTGPAVVIAAHLDTVFAAGTDVTVKREGNVCRAPGISDDARGLAVLLEVLRVMQSAGISTERDVYFVGTIGEEGNGDLRGAKHFVANPPQQIGAFISVDGANVHRVLKGSTGSRRIRAVFEGPGGHSWNAFGRASANHALGRAVARIADMQVPDEPRTSFTVGLLSGGTSVNAISGSAQTEIDMRSVDPKSLDVLYEKVCAIVRDAADEENRRWNAPEGMRITVKIENIGFRPAGVCPPESAVLQCARAALKTLGLALEKYSFASTDQNAALAAGIPATTLGGGGSEGFNHNINEWYDATNSYQGPQAALLTIVALAGLSGVSVPLV